MRLAPLVLALLFFCSTFSGCFGILENTNFENSDETLENTTISENETAYENETTNENETANENETTNETANETTNVIETYSFSCMGLNEYCYRGYDNFTFAETHNSFATRDDQVYYPASNHATGLTAQWNGGIRAFMLDTYHNDVMGSKNPDPEPTDIVFCHGDANSLVHPCSYSEVDAFAWLNKLSDFMDDDETQIVTLLLENFVPANHLEYLFNETGLLERTYIHEIGDTWPNLGEMILSKKTLVVFWEPHEGGAPGDAINYPWLHHTWTHSWDTNYGEQNEEDMDCDLGRGDKNQPVWHLNNWLSNAIGLSDPTRSEDINSYDKLLERTVECWEEVGKRPTFIAVDWWDDGDVVGVVDTLNQMGNWDE